MKTIQILGDSKYGGATYLVLRWCRYLLEKGCDVTVVCTDEKTISRFREVEDAKIVKSILIPRNIAPVSDLRAFQRLLRMLRFEEVDVVHTYTATPGFIGRIAARIAGVPVILHHQAGWPVTEWSSIAERAFYTPLEYLATLVSSRSICVSHSIAKQAESLRIAPRRKLVTICNGIDPEPFEPRLLNGVREAVRQRLGISTECLLVGSTGRLAEQKDNTTLIRSMFFVKQLLGKNTFKLLVAGEGPEMNKLEALVKSMGLASDVRFLGFYSGIPGLLSALDIFVSTSLREGLSISIMEAMAASKPIIATNILPNAELIVNESTGLLVPPKSPREVAQAIGRFVQDGNLAMRCGAAARQRVLEKYSIDRMFQETWDLYVDLLAK